MKQNLTQIIEEAAKERGVAPGIIVSAIETGISLAAQRKTNVSNLRAKFDSETGGFSLWRIKTAREEPNDSGTEISLKEAIVLNRGAKPGDDIAEPYPFEDLGRIAAITTRKVMQKNLRDLEMENRVAGLLHDTGKMLVVTVIGKNEKEDYLLKAGDTLAVLPRNEQAFRESFLNGEVIKVIIIGAEPGGDEPVYTVSRTHPLLLRHLFAREIPEVAEGVVLIKALARDTAGRAKVAVYSSSSDIDAVGTCIGPGGSRIQNIIRELKGENVDIIPWSENPEEFIAEALKPAKVKSVKCDSRKEQAWVTLEPDQQGVAVGKKGLNIRLASRLTRWNIHIL